MPEKEWLLDELQIKKVCRVAYQGLTAEERDYWDPKLSSVLSSLETAKDSEKHEVLAAVSFILENNDIGGDYEDGQSFNKIEELESFQLLLAKEPESIIRHRTAFFKGYVIGLLKQECSLHLSETERAEILRKYGSLDSPEARITIAKALDRIREETHPDSCKVEAMPSLAIRKAEEDGFLVAEGSVFVNQKDSMQSLVAALWRRYGHNMPTRADIQKWVISKKRKPYTRACVSMAFSKIDGSLSKKV